MNDKTEPSPLAPDLQELMRLTAPAIWEALRSQSIFLAGGTGFVGRWLVEALLHAQRELQLGLSLTVLSRDPGAFLTKHPHLAGPALHVQRGDITHFDFPAELHGLAVYAALPVAAASGVILPGLAERGCERMAAFAQQRGVQRLLHISSGAVYGPQPADATLLDEDRPWDVAAQANGYTVAKRTEEAVLARSLPGQVVTARCFAFIGPGLEASTGTAAAQFIDSARRGEPVALQGDGAAVRSYQYASDMARWLLALLAMGVPGRAYNVGSEEAVSLTELARRVHQAAGIAEAPRLGQGPATGRAGNRYVPATGRIRQELPVAGAMPLDEAVARSLRFARTATIAP